MKLDPHPINWADGMRVLWGEGHKRDATFTHLVTLIISNEKMIYS